MRNYRTLIKEAELLAASPQIVVDWLQSRSANVQLFRDIEEADEDLEQALLARNEPLIDFALARYCVYPDVARALFEKASGPDANNRQAKALRLAILANQSLAKARMGLRGFPSALVPENEFPGWLARADYNEIAALFENPSLDDSFLESFLDSKESWQALNEDRRLVALYALTRNSRMKAPYDQRWMDGYAEYRYNSVFNAAWKLAGTAPTTPVWAHALSYLYQAVWRHSSIDSLKLTERWHPDQADAKSLKDEAAAIERGNLGGYGRVRQGLAQLALSKKSGIGPELLASDDPAFRAAAYASMALTPEQIVAAYEKDKELAVNEAVHNEELWRRPETREALQQICWRAVRDDKHSDLLAANVFNAVEERMMKEHPQWFANQLSKEPATKSDVHMLAEGVASKESSELVARSLAQLRETLNGMGRRLGWLFLILGVLIAFEWRHF